MQSFRQFIGEKVEALLRLPVTAGIPSGYAPVRHAFPQRPAPVILQRRIQDLANDLKAGRGPVKKEMLPVVAFNPATLIPTQNNVAVEDIEDIVAKGGLGHPIIVARLHNKLYIVDGHHRAAAAVRLQQPIHGYLYQLVS